MIALAAALVWPGLASGAGKGPAWTVYADCAAAYQANARVADPDRPAAMIDQVSDVAKDYEAAAKARYRPARRARAAVRDRIQRLEKVFAAQPREAVERV